MSAMPVPLICGVYPRVGGGTPKIAGRRLQLWGLSPRGRGNRKTNGEHGLPGGSIPAWAGEPLYEGVGK